MSDKSTYIRVMFPRDLNFDDVEARFVVRVYDGMDHCWCDCTEAVTAEDALSYWMKQTLSGTSKTKFSDIDYYRIFPANTRMLFNSEECER